MYFKKIRKKRNLTLEELAQKSGGYKSNLSLVENGKLNLKLGLAQRISKVLNCRVSDLTGETIFDDKKELSKTIQVKYFKDIFVSAGCGCFINNENYELIDIEETFFKKINENNYNNIVVVNAVGDSMSPTIKNGDLLFIDTSKKDIINNKIYIINENNYLKVII